MASIETEAIHWYYVTDQHVMKKNVGVSSVTISIGMNVCSQPWHCNHTT